MHESFRGLDRDNDEIRQAFAGFLALALREKEGTLALRDVVEFMVRHESWLLDQSPQGAFDLLKDVMQWYAERIEENPMLLSVAMFDAPAMAYSRPSPITALLPPEHWRL